MSACAAPASRCHRDGVDELARFDDENVRLAARESGRTEAEVRRLFREWDLELVDDLVLADVNAAELIEVWLTKAQAAARAQLSPSTLERAMRAGELPYSGGGGYAVRIRAVDLDEWLRHRGRHEPG